MKTLQERRKEWLDSHLAVYLADPSKRSVKDGKCLYRSENSKCCIIGQDITDEMYNPVMENETIEEVIYSLPTETQELGIHFLIASQDLHDHYKYWSLTGLTTDGTTAYNEIIRDFCTN